MGVITDVVDVLGLRESNDGGMSQDRSMELKHDEYFFFGGRSNGLKGRA